MLGPSVITCVSIPQVFGELNDQQSLQYIDPSGQPAELPLCRSCCRGSDAGVHGRQHSAPASAGQHVVSGVQMLV